MSKFRLPFLCENRGFPLACNNILALQAKKFAYVIGRQSHRRFYRKRCGSGGQNSAVRRGITVMWSQRTHTVMFWQNPSVKWPIQCQNFWAKSRPFDRFKNGFEKPLDRHLTDIKNLEIPKAAKSNEKSSFSEEKLLFRWQPKKDSNPHKQSQSLSCYHYTIRLSFVSLALRLY